MAQIYRYIHVPMYLSIDLHQVKNDMERSKNRVPDQIQKKKKERESAFTFYLADKKIQSRLLFSNENNYK